MFVEEEEELVGTSTLKPLKVPLGRGKPLGACSDCVEESRAWEGSKWMVVFRSKGALSCLVEKSTGVNVAEESVVIVAVSEVEGLVEASRASKSMSKLASFKPNSQPGKSLWWEKSWLRNSEKSSWSWSEDQFS